VEALHPPHARYVASRQRFERGKWDSEARRTQVMVEFEGAPRLVFAELSPG